MRVRHGKPCECNVVGKEPDFLMFGETITRH
jgi:hypothetical protein